MRPIHSLRRPLALLVLASILFGCQGTGYVIEDIEEGALDLVGQGPTLGDRLATLAKTHDRTNDARWVLLPRSDDANPLRRALREITLLEREEYKRLGARARVLMLLAPYATRSDSKLIRARVVRAVGVLAEPFETNPDGRPVGPWIKEAGERLDAARRAYVAKRSEESFEAFVDAAKPIANVRLWPLEHPLRTSALDAAKRADLASDLALRINRAIDREKTDIDGSDPISVGARSLVAELARLVASYALVHDPEPVVRADAVEVFSELGDPESADLLAAVAGRELDGAVRRRIARAFARVGARPEDRDVVVPALIRLAGDTEDDVRHQAFVSLRTVTGVDHGVDLAAWRTWWDGARAEGDAPDGPAGG